MSLFRKKPLRVYAKELDQKERRWSIEKELIQRENEINYEKRELRKKRFPKITTTKILIAFLFLNCTIIEIFTGWAIVKMFYISLMTGMAIDFSPLVTLIGAVVTEVIGYAIYALKSTKENTVGGIVYDKAMKDDEGAVG